MKKTFTLFAIALLSSPLFATVHYTSLYDIVSASNPKSYDLDLDGDNDFNFVYDANYSFTLVHCNKVTSFYAANGTANDSTPKAYAGNAALGTYHWANATGMLTSGSGAPFDGVEKYLMVKFQNTNGNTYYGWIDVYGVSAGEVEILGIAYDDVPNETIKAGQTTAAINEIDANFYGVNKITANGVSFLNTGSFDKVSVVTLEGKTISTINHPLAGREYPYEQTNNVLIVAFYKNGQLVGTKKYMVQ